MGQTFVAFSEYLNLEFHFDLKYIQKYSLPLSVTID